MIGVFCALDLVVFYVFFEGGLIPMFLIIGVWGGARRVYATFKFFLYTLLGSVLMLLAIMAIYIQAGTSDIVALYEGMHRFPVEMQRWLWLAFFASFAVKLPMWPVHTWLPDAHVEAPTAGSVILAGILLKMGGYGFLRFSLPMFPQASVEFAPFVFVLSLIAIVYTSLVALAQEDMKKLIAYSSVAHMGLVTLGAFTFSIQGVDGAIFQMLSHGIVSGALFLCVGVIYDRMHTREIAAYGGLVHRMPLYAVCFMVFTLANVGLPGTSGFVGEFLSLLAAFRFNTWLAIVGTTGVILSAVYALYLYRRVIFGTLEKASLQIDHRPRAPRGRLPGDPGRADDLLRRLSQSGLRCHPRLDRASHPAPPARRRSRHRGAAAMNLAMEAAHILPELVLALGRHGASDARRVRRRQASGGADLPDGACCSSSRVVWSSSRRAVDWRSTARSSIDDFARFVKVLVLGGAALVLIMGQSFLKREKLGRFEFPVLVVFSVLGMMVMASAADFMTLYLGLELQSLALYVLAAFDRDNVRSTEAGPQIFRARRALVGNDALRHLADLRLYRHDQLCRCRDDRGRGRSLHRAHLRPRVPDRGSRLQGLRRAVPHVDARRLRGRADADHGLLRGLAQDRGHGAVLARGDRSLSRRARREWRQIVIFISILSMVLGAFAAIGQNNIKRLMAYSSIANMGYILVGLAAGTAEGVQGVLIYLAIYLITNVGVFACILGMRRGPHMVENISDLAGMAQTRPGYAFVFAMLMFSLAGIPPLAGFFAKFYVFLAAVQAGLYPLAVIGVVASVVGAYYYVRIVKIIYFDEPAPAFEHDMGASLAGIITASGVFTVFFLLGAAPLITAAGAAAASLFP